MNIVVLAGGTSTEREISIISGKGVCEGLRARGHRAILLDVFFGDYSLNVENQEELFPAVYDTEAAAEKLHAMTGQVESAVKQRRQFFGPNVLKCAEASDIVFLALHGANGEDGKVQAAFDLFGIRYTGTGHLSSALAMDKTMTKLMLSAGGVPTPKGISFVNSEADAFAEGSRVISQKYFAECMQKINGKDMHFPLIVKPCCGGSSVGIKIANNEAEFCEALSYTFSFEEEAVVEEFIAGREFSVAVIDQEAFPIIEVAPKEGFYDYKNKYSAGSTVETCPAQISAEKTKEMQELAKKGAEALGITDYCRFDFLMTKDGSLYALEANTLPGMTPTSLIPQEAAALGMDYPHLCEHLINISLRKYRQKECKA